MPFAWARSAMRAPTLTAAVLLAALFASPRTPASREVACASVVPAASSMSCTEIQRSVLETARRGRPAVPACRPRGRVRERRAGGIVDELHGDPAERLGDRETRPPRRALHLSPDARVDARLRFDPALCLFHGACSLTCPWPCRPSS